MSSGERLEELILDVMRGGQPMTASQIAAAIHRHSRVRADARSVTRLLRFRPKRFVPKRSRFFVRTRWQMVEAGPADEPGTAGAPVPARPYPPTLFGGAAAELEFREDEPPTNAVGRTA